jgi:hypothetical protein
LFVERLGEVVAVVGALKVERTFLEKGSPSPPPPPPPGCHPNTPNYLSLCPGKINNTTETWGSEQQDRKMILIRRLRLDLVRAAQMYNYVLYSFSRAATSDSMLILET